MKTLTDQGIIVKVDIKLDWIDVLRVLFGGIIHFQTAIKTEYYAGKNEVEWECIYVDTIFPAKPEGATTIENRK